MKDNKAVPQQNINKWFALGAPYRNEVRVYEALCGFGIKSWVPLIRVQQERAGRKKWVTRPAVGNLLFAYSTIERLREVKPLIPRMQFKVYTEDGESKFVTVPDGQMDNFISFVGRLSAVPEFVDLEKLNLKAGCRVKVVGGTFEGVEGTFVKLKNRRSKVLCISLDRLGSAIVEVSPSDVQAL